MPHNGPVFQDHYAIEQRTLERSPLLKALADAGHFDIHAPENRIFLPADPAFAQTLGVTPHSGGPIADYQIGLQQRLRRLEQTPDGSNALNGDPLALQRITGRVEALRDNVRVGLINGDLYTNAPHGLKSNDIRPQVQSFFFNEAAYGQIHAPQLQQLKSFTPVDNGWAAVTHEEQRVVTTVQHAQTISNPLTRGGDADLQRQGLSQAISNAYQSGRLTMTPRGIAVVENSLGVEAAKPLRVPRAQGFATMDLLIGEASASQLVRSGGLLASGADAILTTRRISEHLQQGNGAAAQSEFNHALARNGGGWLGGMATASVIGTSSFVPAAVVAADALFMSKAFDKGADLLDNRAVYHQKDNAGVQWKFDGNNWQRQARMENSAAGSGVATEHSVGASYEKARELGAKASVSAVELALKDAPAPQDPFRLPARADEGRGFGNPDWHRDAQTQLWTRQIKTDVVGANDRGVYETQTATPERAAELNQQAVQRIEDNIAHGKAAIAASYLENRAATRASDFVPLVPDAVEAARARPDAILGSDNVLYQRDNAGNWSHEGRVAQGNMALELEATRTIQQPSIEILDRTIAALEARPAPTNAEMNRNEVRHGYASAGITPSPQWMEAIELATARTRAQQGITGATMQQLAPAVEGNAGESRAITHYQVGADGVAHPVATTTTEELRAAWREVRERAAQEAPIPQSPELRIAALSPREQEAYQQALQEANRQGAATVDAGQVAMAAAQQVQRGAPVATEADETMAEAQREQIQHRVPASSEPAAAAAPSVAAPAPVTERDAPEIAKREEPREVRREPEAPRQDEPQQAKAPERTQEVAEAPTARTPRGPAADVAAVPDAVTHRAHAEEAQRASTPDTPESTHEAVPPITPEPVPEVTHAPVAEHAQPELPLSPAPPAHVETPEAPAAQNSDMAPVAERLEKAAQHDDPLPPTPTAEEGALSKAELRTDTNTATPHPVSTVFGPAQPDHPDHALYQQIRQGIEALDAKHGRGFDQTSERMAASLTVLAKDNDLERVDHVLVSNATAEHPAGHSLFLVQGEPADPAHHRASMPTEQAAQTSVEESMQQLDVVSREAQQRAVANQMEQQLDDQRVQHEIQIRAASGGG